MDNFIIFYHKNCADGFGAAWAARKLIAPPTGLQLIPIDFGSSHDMNKLAGSPSNTTVLFFDVVPDMEWLQNDLLSKYPNVEIHDHHVSNRDLGKQYNKYYFNNNLSGCILAWNKLSSLIGENNPAPLLLQYVQDRDLWKWKLENSHLVNDYIITFPMNDYYWDKISEDIEKDINRVLFGGSLIGMHRTKQIDFMSQNTYKIQYENKTYIVSNCSYAHSEFGSFLVNEYNCFGAILWSFDGNKIRVSFRSKNNNDVSIVAKSLGGGGHKNAAGALIDANSPLGKLLLNEKI